MSEKDSESIFQGAWQTFSNRSDCHGEKFSELTSAVQKYSDSVARFNLELLSLGSQLAAEHAKLRKRLLACHDAPRVIRLELDYLDTMRQHYLDELTRLFGVGDEVMKRGIMAWSNGSGPHEVAVGASQRNARFSR